MVGEAVAAAAPEKTADERIADCLAEGRSFVLDAGAGAGKTYSLVEGLKKLCAPPVAARLRRDGQQIACITYTILVIIILIRVRIFNTVIACIT